MDSNSRNRGSLKQQPPHYTSLDEVQHTGYIIYFLYKTTVYQQYKKYIDANSSRFDAAQ